VDERHKLTVEQSYKNQYFLFQEARKVYEDLQENDQLKIIP